MLVEQKEAQVDIFRRNEEGMWMLERYAGLDSEVLLKAVDIKIPMKRIYHGIRFEV